MQRLKEKLLVFQVSEGKDPRAFEQLYELYFERISRFIYFKVNAKEEAEDLTSQIFLKTWEYLTDEQAKRVQNFKAFIYQLARNLVVDYYRRQGRAPEIVSLEDQSGEEENIPDHRQSFFLNQLYKSDQAYLSDCLKNIKDEYREIIVLRFLEDMGVEEIAKIIDKTPSNVRVLIHRALKALREIYDQREGSNQTIKNPAQHPNSGGVN